MPYNKDYTKELDLPSKKSGGVGYAIFYILLLLVILVAGMLEHRRFGDYIFKRPAKQTAP